MTEPEERELAAAFERAAAAQPERVAVFTPDGALTMAEVRVGAARLARQLAAAGVRPGDAVALMFNSARAVPRRAAWHPAGRGGGGPGEPDAARGAAGATGQRWGRAGAGGRA